MWPERAGPHGEPELTDGERDRVVALLRLHCTEGRITLDEFSDRIGLVYAAQSARELDRLVNDVPVPWRDQAPEPAVASAPPRGRELRRRPRERAPRRPIRWLVAVFSQSTNRGRFRLDEDSVALATFGECTVDLTDALIEASCVTLSAIAVFGQVTVIVPEGIHVEVDGAAIFGERRFDLSAEPPVPGSPTIVIKAYAVFGEVRVRSPRGARK